MAPTPTPAIIRILRRVAVTPAGCWVYSGARPLGTHRDVRLGGKMAPRAGAHRVVYEHLAGPIPDGFVLDHLCRVPACVNPAHLEPVTQRTNTIRGVSPAAENAALTSCRRGHPFDEANTYVTSKGRRQCRACQADRCRQYEQRGRKS